MAHKHPRLYLTFTLLQFFFTENSRFLAYSIQALMCHVCMSKITCICTYVYEYLST